jgi:intracellular sulfur oxidation DsrE/DsrF family protein
MMSNAGARITAGGQSLAHADEANTSLAPEVTLALSGIVAIADLQQQGYVEVSL